MATSTLAQHFFSLSLGFGRVLRAVRQSGCLHFRSVFIFIIFGQAQLFFRPGLCAVNGVDRH
jgi:hypothetical protein